MQSVYVRDVIERESAQQRWATDPFANAASKAARTLGYLPLKPEQTQVVNFWSVGRVVFAVLATLLTSVREIIGRLRRRATVVFLK